MRSGRGKCPQCREMIVVDLDAPELRCPYCNALLKKSAKKPEPLPEKIEKEEIIAPVVAEVAPASAPVPAPEAAPAPLPEEIVKAVEEEAESSPEEMDIPSAVAAEPATEQEVTEEIPAEEPVAPEEEADEIGLTDEELAMMDEAPAEVATESEEASEPVVYGSIGADAEDLTPEEIAAEEPEEPLAEDAPAEDVSEEEAPVNNNIELADDQDVAALDDDFSALVAPMEETPAKAESEAAPQAEQEPVEIQDQPDIPSAPEEVSAEETPVEESPVEESPAEDVYVPSEEDMAFAASLSDTGRGYVAPTTRVTGTARTAERSYKRAASEAQGGAIYKKPVAILMMILSILAAAVWFLYYKVLTVGLISQELLVTLGDALPTFGGEDFPLYVVIAFTGLIAVTSILGIMGKKGKIAFLLILIADLVYAFYALFGGVGVIVEVEALTDFVSSFGEYFIYAMNTLVLAAAVLLAVALSTDRESFGFSRAMSILPAIYLALVVIGHLALIFLPYFLEDFTVSAEIVNYAILGVIGATLLLTFVGVHNGALSRSANGWLLFAALLALFFVNVIPLVVTKVALTSGMLLNAHAEIPYYLTPILAIFGTAGFAASDMRN